MLVAHITLTLSFFHLNTFHPNNAKSRSRHGHCHKETYATNNSSLLMATLIISFYPSDNLIEIE